MEIPLLAFLLVGALAFANGTTVATRWESACLCLMPAWAD